MIEQAVVLAAGRGVRLGPLTKDRPKAMLPVLGKPIIARVMDRMYDAGVRRFVVVVGEQEGAVAAYLNKSWHPDCAIHFALQPAPLGTADALRRAASHLLDGPFLFAACDNLAPPDHVPGLIERFEALGGDLALTLIHATPEEISRSACVQVDGDRVVSHVEKPPVESVTGDLLSVMIYACSPKALEGLDQVPASPRGEKEFAHVITRLIDSGARVGYRVASWRLHLTGDEDLLRINQRLLEEERDAHILSELPRSVVTHAPVRIDPGVSVGRGAHIGPNVYLETGCTVGQGARISNSVVLSGGVVPAGETVDGTIVARR